MNASTKRDSVSRLMKAWESKNAKRAAQGAGLSTMAVTLAACGGSSTTSTNPVTDAPANPVAQTFTLTTDVNSGAAFTGGAGDDVYNATATTFTALDALDGAAGTDVLNIVAAAGLSVAPAGVTLTSIETVNISSGAAIGVVAGAAAVPQVDKVTFAAVTGDVAGTAGSKQFVFAAVTGGSGDGAQQMTYDGMSASFTHVVATPATTATNFAAAVNATAGKTVAYTGKAVDASSTNFAAVVAAGETSVVMTDAQAAGVVVGMLVTSNDASDLASGTYVTATSSDGTNTTVTFSAAVPAGESIAVDATLTFGGGTAGVTILGENAGEAAKAVSFGTSGGDVVSVTQSLVVTNVAAVDGSEGTVVTFTYAGQSGQYTIGADNDTTATAFAAAFNAVASDATAAVVNSGTSDYVTITATTAGTALGALVFVSAGANTPTVTTTTANVAGGDAVAAYDLSGIETAAVNVTAATSANMKVLTTSDVNISGVTGAITIDGGKDVSVSDKTANNAIDLDNAVGTVSVTDTKQGTGDISVDDATDVTVTAGGRTTGTITLGATDEVTGAVNITATGVDYDAAASNVTLGAISVTGGTTVAVTSVAAGSTSKAVTDTSSVTKHVQGTVTVNAEDNTTAVTIIQDKAQLAVDAEAAVAAKAATQTITFTEAAATDTVTITFDSSDTLTFTASKNLTAAEVAQAFANLTKNATEGSASAASGLYSNAGTINTGWTSGAVSTNAAGTEATVTFSNAAASPTALSVAAGNGDTVTVTAGSVVAGAAANQAVTGRMGVDTGAVDINGATKAANDAVTTVTLTNFASANIDSDVLATVNATGTAGAMVIDSENTGTLTVNAAGFATGSQVNLSTATKFTGLTLNIGEGKFVGDIVASDVTSLTINAASKVTSESATNIDAVKTLTVTGAGAVNLGTVSAGLAGSATSIDASGNSGGLTITYGSDTGTMTGGSGADVITTDSETISKAVDLGAGDDTFVLAAHSSGTSVTASLDGGDGEDTLSMSSAAAAHLDDSTVFADDITGFEVLKLGTLANSANIVAKNLGLNEKVLVAGTASSNGSATVSTLAANATVEMTAGVHGSGTLTLALDDATGTSDVINIATNVDGDLSVGEIVVANVETVNLSAVDKFTDVTGAKDEFDANIADGKDDTNSVQSIKLDIDEATTLNITGSADLTVDLDDGNNSGADIKTSVVDASTFTGKLTLIADGLLAGTTVTGGSGDDTLTADGSNDKLIGGAGDDVLTAAALSTLTGGAGVDTFVVGGSAVTSSTYSTITDLEAGDVIDIALATSSGAFTEGMTFTATAVSLAANATFAQYLDAAAAGTADAEANSVAADEVLVRWFQFNGDTFIVMDREDTAGSSDATGFGAGDTVIAIDGLFDVSLATLNSTTGQFVF